MPTLLAPAHAHAVRQLIGAGNLDDFLRTLLSSPKDTSSPHPQRLDRDYDDGEVRAFLRTHSQHPRVRTCGIRWQCQNEFLCPFCTPKRLRRDRAAIAEILRGAHSSEFATLTMSHCADDSLGVLWSTLTEAWRLMTKGKGWDQFKNRHGLSGQVKAFDVTWSPDAGWHPHWHLGFSFSGERSDSELIAFRAELATRWVSKLEELGRTASRFQLSEAIMNTDAVAKYLTDGGPRRRAHPDGISFTLGDLLQSATGGDLRARELVHEFEVASKGRQAISLGGVFYTMRTEHSGRARVKFV
jgi:hypothetical protein